ncbi:hypothetical protein TEA_016146 [Camellia sinensis var. sinensis]|uniref:Autophagy-related protein n=1 Tax=Camellia sinensis var. sinensis TaxID=542762 RepID=A0A4S4EB63_CAMSN|nr:hypothetical protein TEA_016146 [Camellia sinensis var. sinensis]
MSFAMNEALLRPAFRDLAILIRGKSKTYRFIFGISDRRRKETGRSCSYQGEISYLVPADLTVGQFVYVVRKRIKLSAEKAIFIFVKNILPPTAAMMSAIYEENKDEDGFLYMTYSGENTFGSF